MIDLNVKPPETWRAVAIPKKDGSSRYLLVPNDELKEVQLNILHYLYGVKQLRPHPCAVGFVPGRNTLTGAKMHDKHAKIIIGIDVHNFFPTFPVERVRTQLLKSGLPIAFVEYVMRYCVFHGKKKDQIPQGAPTSPLLTNIGMYPFDIALNTYARRCGYAYSRYADDMTFSAIPGQESVAEMYKIRLLKGVERMLKGGLGLTLSHKKTRVCYDNSPRVRRNITGITISQDGEKLSAQRSTREKARTVTHTLYKKLKVGIPAKELTGLYRVYKGLVNYCDNVRREGSDDYTVRDTRIDRKKRNFIEKEFKCISM